MTALERAAEDVARGDHWLARRRLESLLQTNGYDNRVLERLGEVCIGMNDAFGAGRAWLLSSAKGEEVEAAIDTFVRHAGGEPSQIIATLYRAGRPRTIEACPDVARERVSRLGLEEALREALRNRSAPGPVKSGGGAWIGTLILVGVCAVILFCITSCTIGAAQILRSLFGIATG